MSKSAFQPTTLLTAQGLLSTSDESNNLRPLGQTKLILREKEPFVFSLELYNATTDKLLLSQNVDGSLNLYYPPSVANCVEWILKRPNKAPQRVRFDASDPNANLQPLSRAFIESQIQNRLENEFKEDVDYVLSQASMRGVEDEGGDSREEFDYVDESKSSRRYYSMSLSDSKRDDSKDIAHDDDDDEDDDDADGPSAAAFKTPIKAASSASRIPSSTGLTSSARKGKETNSLLAPGMKLNRSYISRGNQLGVFAYGEDDGLEYLNRIPAVKDMRGQTFTPQKLQLHDADTQLLMLDTENRDRVYQMDLETGKVVDEWQGGEGFTIRNIAPTTKYSQVTNENLIVGVNDKGIFTLDPRINKRDKLAMSNMYASKVYFSSLATNMDGYLAVASDKGDIRLYDKLDKRAKTALPGLGNPVTHLDVTADGSWLLATTKNYLVVYPLRMKSTGSGSTEKLGFTARMGQDKPMPLKLSISPQDMVAWGIQDINFTPAFFNTGTMANTSEEWIATSTGDIVVTWNFNKVKQGNTSAYKLHRAQDRVVMDKFRHNFSNELLIAETDNVYMSKLSKRKE